MLVVNRSALHSIDRLTGRELTQKLTMAGFAEGVAPSSAIDFPTTGWTVFERAL
jgi:hypothetical protein